MASELKYYNRDAIYWRVADQYGFLLRNIMFNNYLKGNTTTSQLGRVLQQHHRSENPQQMEVAFSARLGDRHFLPDPETAYQAFTTWVKFWFLSVGRIKALVNDLFTLLDWCLEQESVYHFVLVDIHIGEDIIDAATKLCIPDKTEAQRVRDKFGALCARNHIQTAIQQIWKQDILPKWTFGGVQTFAQSHGQLLQKVFNGGDRSLCSLLHRTFVGAQKMIYQKGHTGHWDEGWHAGVGGPFRAEIENLTYVTEPFFEPDAVTTMYNIQPGDHALDGFAQMFLGGEKFGEDEFDQQRKDFLYKLYLAGYANAFEVHLPAMTKALIDTMGQGAEIPRSWEVYTGSYYNKIPAETWKELMKIGARVRGQSERSALVPKRAMPIGVTQSLPTLRPAKKQRTGSTDVLGKRRAPGHSAPPRIDISVKKRRRGEETEAVPEVARAYTQYIIGGVALLAIGGVLYTRRGRA